MADIILVTGGNRSGKSDYAQKLAEKGASRRIFVATAPKLDAEMAARIAAHQAARDAKLWHATFESQTDLAGVVARAEPHDIFLIDSLGMWVNNLLHANPATSEALLQMRWQEVQSALDAQPTLTAIFVADEVGCGLIGEGSLARRFCDLNGYLNALVAACAAEVTFLSCGIALPLKQRK